MVTSITISLQPIMPPTALNVAIIVDERLNFQDPFLHQFI